ncbi:GIY-YIG nuclease family protein [Devosia elaeis]|uniref:Uncharacterized protein n=1 Tax=Devosia elaeis TaxID=1770058 RepID=A0A178I0I5_9HYPH|nr:GIY-YIG nuclease family protein [Devosia elaeis]OAM77715.1 hypothetical protein A3840_08800 [Devosia elaeis]
MQAANDNGFVRMTGGGNTNATLAMLERMHTEISAINADVPSRAPAGAFSVYVIGGVDPDFVKIGKASSVVSRLRSLQTGNPLRLFVHRIFKFEKTSFATKVETWAHQDAGRLYAGGVGEWFRCGSVEAHNLIADICEKERIACRVFTPKIESQWKLDEPVGQKYLEDEAERKQHYWEERDRRWQERQEQRNARRKAA